MKRTVKTLLSMMTTIVVMSIASIAYAQDAGISVEAAKANQGGYIALAAGLGLGLAALGGALGQGRAAATALDG
ncbi:MAG TPA: F0F1 ATP synthase subunit C, partial [Kofleriaceae bacterium]|nr:F0F1 ATP synthase subunit C [Kofleriaceae bacterium]